MNMNTQMSARHMNDLAFLFGSFKPSERNLLLGAATTAPSKFVHALEAFLGEWASAGWIEEYNIERVGKWIAKNCPADMTIRAKTLAETKLVANDPADGLADSVYTLTYKSLLAGLSFPKS
jgi:hypothetical protein